jgi:hypothetical protein
MTMPDTIPQPTPPLEDYRVTAARQALGEMPLIADIENPYFWLARLSGHVRALAGGWPSGTPGGLSNEHREVLAAALADAADYREARASDGYCADCEASESQLCSDHEADFDLHDAYVALAAELGLELGQ